MYDHVNTFIKVFAAYDMYRWMSHGNENLHYVNARAWHDVIIIQVSYDYAWHYVNDYAGINYDYAWNIYIYAECYAIASSWEEQVTTVCVICVYDDMMIIVNKPYTFLLM